MGRFVRLCRRRRRRLCRRNRRTARGRRVLVSGFVVPPGEKLKLTKMAARIEDSTPVHSIATLASIPAAALTLAAISSGVSFISTTTVRTPGTSVLANSSREGKRSVITIGSQPAARAASNVTRPMGPAPLGEFLYQRRSLDDLVLTHAINSGSPSFTSALSSPANATANGSQSAPSSKLTLSGNRWSHWAGWRCHRVNVPWYGGVLKKTTFGPF